MGVIYQTIRTLRMLAGKETGGERAQMRWEYTKATCWEVAKQTRNIAVVFGCGAMAPSAVAIGNCLYRMSPPGRIEPEQYELLKALSLTSGLLCVAALMPRCVCSIGKRVRKIYNPSGARNREMLHKLKRLVMDILKIGTIILFVAAPYLLSSRLIQLILINGSQTTRELFPSWAN